VAPLPRRKITPKQITGAIFLGAIFLGAKKIVPGDLFGGEKSEPMSTTLVQTFQVSTRRL